MKWGIGSEREKSKGYYPASDRKKMHAMQQST